MDKAKVVEVPTEKLPIKPSKKDIEKEIEEAVIVDEVEEVENLIDTSNLIENLKNGMVVRFNFGVKKKLKKVLDLFFEDGEFVLYTAFENSNGDVQQDEEEVISESEVIEFYINHNDKISEEFYDDGTGEEDEEEIISTETEEKSKAQMYQDIIEGYELALELETNKEKIKMYQDIIEGYELALELEN
jgi:hypothetical protein